MWEPCPSARPCPRHARRGVAARMTTGPYPHRGTPTPGCPHRTVAASRAGGGSGGADQDGEPFRPVPGGLADHDGDVLAGEEIAGVVLPSPVRYLFRSGTLPGHVEDDLPRRRPELGGLW